MSNEFFQQNLQNEVQNRISEYPHRILHIQNSVGIKFQLKLTILNFWSKLTQKGYFQFKKEKQVQHYWILHIRITLGAKFYSRQTILNVGPNLPKKTIFCQKRKKQASLFSSKTATKRVLSIPNFDRDEQFWFFGPNLPKKGISVLKQKKWPSQ